MSTKLAPSYLHCNERAPGVLLACDIRNELTFEESVKAIAQYKREILEEAGISPSAPPCIGGSSSPLGKEPLWVNFENEDFTWDDLASLLVKRFGKPDIEDLIYLLKEKTGADTRYGDLSEPLLSAINRLADSLAEARTEIGELQEKLSSLPLNEWDALSKEEMWELIQEIRILVDSDGTCSPADDVRRLVEENKDLHERRKAMEKALQCL